MAEADLRTKAADREAAIRRLDAYGRGASVNRSRRGSEFLVVAVSGLMARGRQALAISTHSPPVGLAVQALRIAQNFEKTVGNLRFVQIFLWVDLRIQRYPGVSLIQTVGPG